MSRAVADARSALGVDRLSLAIHDACLPGGSDDDIGRGAATSRAALDLAAFARATGFDALQLGPPGLTDEDDPSPYMGTLFSRNPLSISLGRLADPTDEWGALLPAERLAAFVAGRPPGAERRMPYASVLRTQRAALGLAFEQFERRCAAGEPEAGVLAGRLQDFAREHAAWLEPDALYQVLRDQYGGRHWMHWQGPDAAVDRSLGEDAVHLPGPAARRREITARAGPALRFYRFVQLLAHEQHARLRRDCRALGLELIGDLQVGVSPRETWRAPGIFLAGYLLGAPPSRTNPDGQPWSYPVLDPDACVPGASDRDATRGGGAADPTRPGDGPALRFVSARVAKMLAEHDALRIDHPQGLVCPWVYRADEPDALRAVRAGARLFSSPDLPDHAGLRRYAIASRGDLTDDPAVARYDDHWVVRLAPAQVERYARVFDRVVEIARRHGAPRHVLLCEVLSTLPHPLERVLERHDLGRFRVTQKADPANPLDVYRAENAEPHDWIMFGNHDTPPLWRLLEEWRRDGRLEGRASQAAFRLASSPASREALRGRLLAEPGLLAHAEIAQLFASPARNVSVFFADWLGLTEIYNRPGILHPENWTLRVPPDWQAVYPARLVEDRALNLPLALWLALRARPDGAPPGLLEALRREAEALRGGRSLD
jgi:4-alpha-glucanotransferase